MRSMMVHGTHNSIQYMVQYTTEPFSRTVLQYSIPPVTKCRLSSCISQDTNTNFKKYEQDPFISYDLDLEDRGTYATEGYYSTVLYYFTVQCSNQQVQLFSNHV